MSAASGLPLAKSVLETSPRSRPDSRLTRVQYTGGATILVREGHRAHRRGALAIGSTQLMDRGKFDREAREDRTASECGSGSLERPRLSQSLVEVSGSFACSRTWGMSDSARPGGRDRRDEIGRTDRSGRARSSALVRAPARCG